MRRNRKNTASEKMTTVEQRAVGVHRWNSADEARIERNLVAYKGETFESIRFCKNRSGRHLRVHLVVREDEFVELFRDAARNGVFAPETLRLLAEISEHAAGTSPYGSADPVLAVAGIGEDGTLTQNIDEELYGSLA
jgi:hypothetical protein